MKRLISAVLALLMLAGSICVPVFAADADAAPYYFEGENDFEAQYLNFATSGAPSEQEFYLGCIDVGNAVGITIVYELNGVDVPITANYFDAQVNGQSWEDGRWLSKNNYFWGNTWKGVKIREAYFEKSGLYYTYLNARVADDYGNIPFSTVNSLKFFKDGKGSNTNTAATFDILAIIPENLAPTVSFYSADGSECIYKDYTYQYTDGYTTINPGAHQDGSRAFAQAMLLSPSEIFALTGEEAPEKAADDTYRYELVWRDAPNGEGNIVEGVYKSGALYADFIPVDNTISYVTFLDTDGKVIESGEQIKGYAPLYYGFDPEKAADADYTYTFAGWTYDGGETVIADINDFVLTENEYVFEPYFIADAILKGTAVLSATEIGMDGTLELSVSLNRGDVTTDIKNGKKQPITSGTITVSYDAGAFVAPESTGSAITFSFDEGDIDGNGNINKTFTLSAAGNAAGVFTFNVGGTVDCAAQTGIEIVSAPVTVEVTGEQAGVYFDGEAVVLNSNTAETGKPEEQTVWEGNAPVSNSDGITFVYEVAGIESPITATRVNFTANGILWSKEGDGWFYNKPWNGGKADGDAASLLTIAEDGRYYLYFNRKVFHGNNFTSVEGLHFFTGEPLDVTDAEGNVKTHTADNKNTNATFKLLAVVGGNLAPTVTYMDAQGEVLESVTHKYTNSHGTVETVASGAVARGELASAEEIFDSAELTAPEKASTNAKITYTFAGWVDADGKALDGIYKSATAYPEYHVSDLRTRYTVQFKNHDGTLLYECEVREGDVPEYVGATPWKDDTATVSYFFDGWDKDITAAPTTSKTDGALDATPIVYTATYSEDVRHYKVTFLSEDGGEEYGYDRIKPEGVATAPVTPEKEADVQYTYTFAGWADAEGSKVDLADISGDITLYAVFDKTLNKYTVTFLDEDGVKLGESTVDYGTPATAPEAEKEDGQWYVYTFEGWVDAAGDAADITSVTGDITVKAVYSAEFVHPFTDIDLSRFYGAAVEYVLANGIMNGASATAFNPGGTTTRAQLVTVLYRMEGEPDVAEYGALPFTDVPAGKFYSEAVIWAYNNGVVNGVSATSYAPNDPVTREQFATILYRYADEIKGYYMGAGKATLSTFEDRNDISGWARDAVKWAIATEDDMYTQGFAPYAKSQYITGVSAGEGKFNMLPKNSATRAEMATMLYRFITGEQLTKGQANELIS